MPELLLELFSEEIPARMQVQAAKDLERLVVGALTDNGLLFEAARAFAGPRRLTLAVTGLPAKQPDVKEEKKGPRVNAPQAAIDGFLKSAGVSLAQCEKRADPKGDYYLAVIDRKGRATADVLNTLLPEAIAKLPWPKSMRWPQPEKFPGSSGMAFGGIAFASSAVRWVRPLHSIVCTLDGEIVPLKFANVNSSNVTWGHRFLSSGAITVKRFDDYTKKLRDAHVIVDGAERRETILEDAKQKTFALGLEVVEDEGLANEVMGLAEWPVVLVGTIDRQFMDLPPEILQTTMRAHQKYFALRVADSGKLANKFVLVANMQAKDGGKEIVAGNERVLRARLADAKFFWDQDRKRTLDSRVADLEGIVFHAKLGTQLERVKRIEALVAEIAKTIGLKEKDIDKVKRAALLCKADLTTGVVGEFPELQGIMGRYYALADGEDREVADAIRDHYKPLGPNDRIPIEPVSVCIALADKLDTLVGLWWVGEKPTGSGDPYALRRACLGVVRIVLANQLRFRISGLIYIAYGGMPPITIGEIKVTGNNPIVSPNLIIPNPQGGLIHSLAPAVEEIWNFFVDRLKVALRDRKVRHDVIDAVLSTRSWQPHEQYDDIVRLVKRAEALQGFISSTDGNNLLVAYRRVANILKDAEKEEGIYDIAPELEKLALPEERELASALKTAEDSTGIEIKAERFVEAMSALAKLRAPVDAFFGKVIVNVTERDLRRNRLRLLSRLRATMHQVADFSKIEG